jgi:hypothetical protein
VTVSVFELFRIGVGPSSSHTVGPMRAGLRFARLLHGRREQAGTGTVLTDTATAPVGTVAGGAVSRPAGITVILYGSLAATGAGHGTPGACLLGLDGCDPSSVNPDHMESRLREIRDTRTIHLAGDPAMPVTCGFEDIILRPAVVRTVHTNAVTFSALETCGGDKVDSGDSGDSGDSTAIPFSETYYSIGGGFIRTADESASGIVLAGPPPSPPPRSCCSGRRTPGASPPPNGTVSGSPGPTGRSTVSSTRSSRRWTPAPSEAWAPTASSPAGCLSAGGHTGGTRNSLTRTRPVPRSSRRTG